MEQQNKPLENNEAALKGIVSINSRGGTSNNFFGKMIFIVLVFAIILIGALIGFNKWRATKKADRMITEQSTKNENKPAAIGQRRFFDTDPPPLPANAQLQNNAGPIPVNTIRPQNGQITVPAVQPQVGNAQPINVINTSQRQPSSTPYNRYAGDVIVTSRSSAGNSQTSSNNSADPMTTLAMVQNILGQGQKTQPNNVNLLPSQQAQTNTTNTPGSIGNLLTPSQTPMVTAAMIGDRNMILPKGRTISCGLSMRLVNEVAGMASCVLSQNVYSDNGRVVLLERGSEATGEYVASMAQGQRRLFVLWTRIKTPAGVVINLNSPAADNLGTSGMDGYVDNHWWDRIGAAFLLSMVQDAIAYETATKSDGGSSQSVAVFQNTSQTGNRMAEKVLESTINIKPTLYKNQGDRGAIYVARDLDFGSVYALRAR